MVAIATRPTTTPAAMPAVFAVFEPGSGVADCEADVFSGAGTITVLERTTTEAGGAKLVTSEVGDGEEDDDDDDDVVVLLELKSGL